MKHATGQSLIPNEPKRVVTLFQGATDTAVALGIQPIGIVDSWAQKPTYQYLRTKLIDVKHVGLETQPNLEEIAALNPDLIIGAKSRHEKIYPQLEQIAPTVMTSNVYDFRYTLELVGEATNRSEQANRLREQWQNKVASFRTALKEKHSNWPLTASIIDVRSDHLRLYLQDSFPGAVLNDIGFLAPLPKRSGWGIKLKTKEALPSINADVFFVMLHSDELIVKDNYQAWVSHPLWKVLKAPREKQVHQVDEITWILSGGIVGANLMLNQLADIYHLPEALVE
ncbi:iron-siderophore ABC transporter substrate-binding protein [Vibrio kasasachensis]|uniref:ABC transporter substrate-binding protein n=1 Tax=Vibrio kasasachensis TaxID=2910248 RepID=UPI003D12D8E2